MASAAAAVMPVPPPTGIKARPTLSIDAAVLAKPSTPAFVVPTILITPPDAPPQYSIGVPEQQYEKSVLFVPVKTEELGWDEHGLYWNGTYAYPVHQIYNKEGQPIGRRRKGPQGYRFEEYYDNKKPRRSSTSHSSASSSSSSSPSSVAADDTVEEASVRLDEPAPQRIEFTAKSVVLAEQVEAPVPEPMEEEAEDLVSPTSPTLSVASDLTQTEDSSSICDDSSSLWSRNDAASDDGESRCTSPGAMSPPMDIDSPAELQIETLSKKLSDLPAANKVNKTSWLSLGTLPSSTASSSSSSSSSAASSRSQSLPVPRATRSNPALEISRNHRATSSPILDPQQREHRRHSTPMAFQSIIQDLTTSPFASSSSAMSAKAPYRSATLPRSTSRTGYKQSKLAGSVLRPPPPQYISTQRNTHDDPSSSSSSSSTLSSRTRSEAWHSTPDSDFAAGWAFENPSSAPMANHY